MDVDVQAIRAKFASIRAAMLATFAERDDTVEAVLVAAVAGEHVCLLGPPGTGKSATVQAFAACVTGATYFDTLLTRFSTEDEVCGPAKLSALKQDRFERNTAGHLPGVDVAFLDETFKGNASVLNALLSVLNERRYKGAPCPLRFAAGASNEMPEDETLGALWDRFLLRHVVDYVQAESAWEAMLLSPPRFVPPCQLTLAEWDAATAASRAVKIGPHIVRELSRLKAALAKDGIVVSDRRWIKLLGALKAAAWLAGDTEVHADHLPVLRFGLWAKLEERDRVKAILDTVDTGGAQRVRAIVDDAMGPWEQRPTDPAALYDFVVVQSKRFADAMAKLQAIAPELSRRAKATTRDAVIALQDAADACDAAFIASRTRR